MRGPSPVQTKVLAFVAQFTAESGFPPTLKEIARHIGATSSTAAFDLVRALVSKGMVERRPKISRGLTLTPAGLSFLVSEPVRRQLG